MCCKSPSNDCQVFQPCDGWVRLDFVAFTAAFNAWVQATFPAQAQEQIAVDGKSIKVSVRDYDQPYQDFVALVSAFNVTQGVVVGVQPMRNGQMSEIQTVQLLLETLHLSGVCWSFDALHTQKNSEPSDGPVQSLSHRCQSQSTHAMAAN